MVEVILGGEAVAAGIVTRHRLRSSYRLVYRGVYAATGGELTLRDRSIAAWLATRRKGVIAGVAASALHGASWVDATQPIEVAGVTCAPQDGLVPRSERVAADEITVLLGLPVTTVTRTAFDVARHLDRASALARLDAMMWAQAFSLDEVGQLAKRYPRAPGSRQLGELLPLVDGGAASPGTATPACSSSTPASPAHRPWFRYCPAHSRSTISTSAGRHIGLRSSTDQ